MKRCITILLLCGIAMVSCGQDKPVPQPTPTTKKQFAKGSVDTTAIDAFFETYPLFAKQKVEVKNRYRANPAFIWYDGDGIVEFAGVLHNQSINIADEGLAIKIPYSKTFDEIIFDEQSIPSQQSELLLTSLYFFYTDKVFRGLDNDQMRQTSWYLPRENRSYVTLLDSLVSNPNLLIEGKAPLLNQYYKLRQALKKYRSIEASGGWGTLEPLPGSKPLQPGDTAVIIKRIRTRLYVEGYLTSDSNSNAFDSELLEGIKTYYTRHHREPEQQITDGLISALNIPVQERIKALTVNMERCRWISPTVTAGAEFIAVNIPSFRVLYVRNGVPIISSKVVVGRVINKTVVFSGTLSHLVFSPYWNVPQSILEKEIKPAIRKNPNYLARNNMEWHNGKVRQRPGPTNSLGLVKFMFPNSNNIYLHDTPAKSLFAKDERAFSHGCIRVEKARELAIAIMENDAGWTPEQVDKRMMAGKESSYRLKTPIPVYIAYFTAWADQQGNVAFFDDVYARDQKLLEMLHH